MTVHTATVHEIGDDVSYIAKCSCGWVCSGARYYEHMAARDAQAHVDRETAKEATRCASG